MTNKRRVKKCPKCDSLNAEETGSLTHADTWIECDDCGFNKPMKNNVNNEGVDERMFKSFFSSIISS